MNPFPRSSTCRLAALFVPTALALAACGSDDPGAPPAPAALALSGTAATGAAIAAAPIDARCASGAGQATTAADGTYRLTIEEGRLPCVLRVTAADGTALHSLASGGGSEATANITPVSELVVARLGGQSPAGFFAAFDAAAAAGLSADAVQAAVGSVVETLKSAGVDLSGVGNVLSAPLAAAVGGAAGNDFDQKLDALTTQLAASGTTLAALTDAIARASPQAPASGLSAVPSLPAELLLRPAAPNCAALRSGRYRLVFLMPGVTQAATGMITLDAPTLTVTGADGEVSQLAAHGDCRYALPNGGEMVVSQAGIGVFRSLEDGVYRGAIALPEQQHPVAAMAGTWNYLGLGDTTAGGGPVHLYLGEMTVDARGQVTRGTFCDDLKTCEDEGPDPAFVFTANAGGGFDFDGGRVFAYRSGGGELLVVHLAADGSFALATRKEPRTLPAIGTLTPSWSAATVTSQYTAPALLSSNLNTTVSHAADGGSYGRDAVVDFATGATRPETVEINAPRDGFIHRVPATVATSSGGTSNVSEWVGLPLRGSGVTPVGLVATRQLILTVNKPAP